MKMKDNKGFTLVEVIAVVAIIGILAVLAVPRIVGLFTTSRNKVYIEDAIRLVSQAKYTMNAKSVKIEKPENGEVIVFSMSYLNSGEFQQPPNGGSYLTDSSFVVVKNSNGEYYYSVMLVEYTKKQQYIGVEFSTESVLEQKDAVKHVRAFSLEELGYVNKERSEANNGQFVDGDFITNQIHSASGDSWVFDDGDIIGYYDTDIDEPEAIADTLSPRVSARFSKVGSMNTVLSIMATDTDNDTSDLKVYYKISKNKNDTYPDPQTATGYNYGNGTSFNLPIDFSVYNFTHDKRELAYVYIVVADPNNNYTQKRLIYDIHVNEEPSIKTFSLSRLPGDKYNMPKTAINLRVEDDMDNSEDLLVCFSQDVKVETCPEYKAYSEYFEDNNTYTYTFKDDHSRDIIEPDGSSHKLYVYVLDSSGAKTKEEVDYSIYLNKNPKIESLSFTTSCAYAVNGVCQCTGNCNSLTVGVNLSVSDDITDVGDIQIKLYQKEGNTEKGVVQMPYSEFQRGDHKYTFLGKYDGESRTLYVDIFDEYGKSDSTSLVLDNVYKDLPPVITKTAGTDFITSREKPCSVCDNGGSYAAHLNFSVSDDTTPVDEIKVCVSENAGECDESHIHTSNFVRYANLSKDFTFSHSPITTDLIYPSPAITKNLYVAIADNYDNYIPYNDYEPIVYQLYNNQPPTTVGNYTITSVSDQRNLVDVHISLVNLQITDDFGEYTVNYCYEIPNGDVCTGYKSRSELESYLSSFRFTDGEDNPLRYKGQTIKSHLFIKDNYNEVVRLDGPNYVLYLDLDPFIDALQVRSHESNYGANDFDVKFRIVDYSDVYSVCVTDQATCPDSNYFSEEYDGNSEELHTIAIDGHERFGWTENYTESNPEKTITIFAKDSYGNVSHASVSYELYALCSGEKTLIDDSVSYSALSEDTISPNKCGGLCYHHHGNDTNGIYANYKKTLNYLDSNVGYTCPVDSTEKLYCDHADCFETNGQNTNNPNVIGLKLFDANETWYYSNSKVNKTVDVHKDYCDGVSGDAYFYPDDYRCDHYFCEEKADNYCPSVIDEEEETYRRHNVEVSENYSIEMASYNLSLKDLIAQMYYVILNNNGRPHSLDDIMTCLPILPYDVTNIDWLNSYNNHTCLNYQNCLNCFNNLTSPYSFSQCTTCVGTPPNVTAISACQTLDTNPSNFQPRNACSSHFDYDQNTADICDIIHNSWTTCAGISMDAQPYTYEIILEMVKSEYPPPAEPATVTKQRFIEMGSPDNVYVNYNRDAELENCKTNYQDECSAYYSSFCGQSQYSSYKQVVSCDTPGVSKYYCRPSGIADGFCIENETGCDASHLGADCREVCYKDVDCTLDHEVRPVVFTCNGYLKTYEARWVSGYISLQETPIRICPEFYQAFSQFYDYEPSAPLAYLKFNPDEIGG